MKKSFLIVGIMGAILSTNGYSDIVISQADENPDMTITVARAAKTGTRVTQKVDSAVIDQNDTDESEDDVEKVGGQVAASCRPSLCCHAVWSGNKVDCLPTGNMFCRNNVQCRLRKKGDEAPATQDQ